MKINHWHTISNILESHKLLWFVLRVNPIKVTCVCVCDLCTVRRAHCPLEWTWPCTLTSVVKCVGVRRSNKKAQTESQKYIRVSFRKPLPVRGLTVTGWTGPQLLQAGVQLIHHHEPVASQKAFTAAHITWTTLRTQAQLHHPHHLLSTQIVFFITFGIKNKKKTAAESAPLFAIQSKSCRWISSNVWPLVRHITRLVIMRHLPFD